MMRPVTTPRIALALALTGLTTSACFTEQPDAEYVLEVSPFANPYIDREAATLRIVLLPGYECPDERPARAYFIEPVGVPGPRPLGLLLHGGNFDYVELGLNANHFAGENRLAAGWANVEAEKTLGLLEPSTDLDVEGAWAGALLDAGFSIMAPANCWGDLWHGTGDGDWGLEGFLRQGAYFVDAALTWAQEREDIDAARTIAIGLGEGGRAVTELALGVVGSTSVPPAAVVVDSSPDWLAGLVTSPAQNRGWIEGLERLYGAELSDDLTPDDRLAALGLLLERDSLVHAVRDLGWRTPIYYAWSSFDERVDPDSSNLAGEEISALYDPDLEAHRVVDWGVPGHAPSNRDFALTTEQIAWLSTHLP
jgi:hypothetical protein